MMNLLNYNRFKVLKEEKYMVEKNNEYIVDIIDNGYEGEG